MPSAFVQSVTRNFLVPNDGNTHCVLTSFVASSNPYLVNWITFSNDNFPFMPQGLYADNTSGTGILTITSQNTGFTIKVQIGAYIALPYPASPNDIWSITGVGQVNIYWVDYPVFPYTYQGSANGGVMITNTSANPVPVSAPVNASGNPYQVVQVPGAATLVSLFAQNAASAQAAAPANLSLRKLILGCPPTFFITTTGVYTITVTLNNVTVYQDAWYASNSAGGNYPVYRIIDFDGETFASGGGNFVITFSQVVAPASTVAGQGFLCLGYFA
jgi:hypothetical protein